MAKLWTTDQGGERWLVNPQLIIANPRHHRRIKKMASRRKRRMPAALRRYWAGRRAKSNYMSAGMLANPRRRRPRRTRRHHRRAVAVSNPPRRRHVRRAHRRHHYRHALRNPRLMGFELPPLQDIAFVGAGLIVPPMLSTYLLANVVPASYQTSQPVIYAVRAASVVIPAMLVRKFVNPRAGNLMLLGGAAAFVIQLIKDFKLFTQNH